MLEPAEEDTDAIDEAAATSLGLNRTDMRLLSILDRAGPMTLGALTAAAARGPEARSGDLRGP